MSLFLNRHQNAEILLNIYRRKTLPRLSTYLQLLLQSSGGALTTVLIHNDHHVCERVYLHLLCLQVILKLLNRETQTANSAWLHITR